MDSDRWQKIERLYYAALELEPEQRTAFLAAACASDAELGREVGALLASNDQASSFLKAPAFENEARRMALEETQPLFLNRRINHYDILSQLGAGGMGEVYLALDTRLERQVALKILPARFTADADRLQRFAREAKAASALNHPNIITIYEIGEATGTHFIAMEFIEGLTLRQRLCDGKLELAEAFSLSAQIGAALAKAHQAGIIHRDIKPENIMVRPDGLVKVLDFGLARVAELSRPGAGAAAVEVLTETGALMGTPRYMSPEQARGQKVDARADIFGLGVVLYEMLTGRTPFSGATMAEVFAALLGKEPEPLAQLAPGLPAELERIIGRALAKERDDRYQTIGELLFELEECKRRWLGSGDSAPTHIFSSGSPPVVSSGSAAAARELSGEAVKSPASISTAQTPPPRAPRRLWMMAVAAMIVAAVAGIFVWFNGARWWRVALGPVTTIPVITMAGLKDNASFSPDGRQIVFSWDGGNKEKEGNQDIYIKLIGVGEPVRLTSAPEHERMAVWSPDGNYIAFQRGDGNYVIPALPGGAERKLGEGGAGLSWSPDGKLLAICSRTGKDDLGSIYLISAETGERVRRLTTPAPPLRDNFPVFAPDGRSVAFVRSLTSSAREIFTVPAMGGAARQVTNDKRPILGLAWTEDSSEIVFSSIRTGGRGLWRIAATGGEPERVVVEGKNPTYPAIARQGHRLVYTDAYDDTNIYLAEGPGFGEQAAATDAPGKFGVLQPLMMSTRDDHSQQFSPDGERIAFVSSRTGSEEIYVCNRDGGNVRQLTRVDGPSTGTPRWSPDGRWIAYDSRGAGSVDVYVISAEGGPAHRFTKEDSFDGTPSWSRDGRWLYFGSNRGDNRTITIWRQRIDEGEPLGTPTQVTRIEAFEGYESPDGKLFYFNKGSGRYGLWSVPVEGGEEKLVPQFAQVGYWRSWGLLPQGVYFISKEAAPRQTIRFISFATGRMTPLLAVDKDPLWYQPGLALSPDGRRLLYSQRDHSNDDILLMENFR